MAPETTKKSESMIDTIGKIMFFARGSMSVFYLGLVWIIFVLIYKFVVITVDLTYTTIAGHIDKTALMIKVLEVVDLVMVSQLVWVVALAGFSLFVSSECFDSNEKSKPEWLDHVDTYSLKLKLAFSIISISGVHALRVYLENLVVTKEIVYAAAVHLIFVIAAIGIVASMAMVRPKEETDSTSK
jgi:uncharacterized protein (TIGR00645 family)